MEEVVDRILSHPLLVIALSLICLLLFYAFLKRLLKMLIFCSLLAAIYFGYVYYLEDDYPLPDIEIEELEELNEQIKKWVPDDLNFSLRDLNQSRPSK